METSALHSDLKVHKIQKKVVSNANCTYIKTTSGNRVSRRRGKKSKVYHCNTVSWKPKVSKVYYDRSEKFSVSQCLPIELPLYGCLNKFNIFFVCGKS